MAAASSSGYPDWALTALPSQTTGDAAASAAATSDAAAATSDKISMDELTHFIRTFDNTKNPDYNEQFETFFNRLSNVTIDELKSLIYISTSRMELINILLIGSRLPDITQLQKLAYMVLKRCVALNMPREAVEDIYYTLAGFFRMFSRRGQFGVLYNVFSEGLRNYDRIVKNLSVRRNLYRDMVKDFIRRREINSREVENRKRDEEVDRKADKIRKDKDETAARDDDREYEGRGNRGRKSLRIRKNKFKKTRRSSRSRKSRK
jgi:hypothetical protein